MHGIINTTRHERLSFSHQMILKSFVGNRDHFGLGDLEGNEEPEGKVDNRHCSLKMQREINQKGF